ncbi:CFI-box-CTERM domain-containing protein [Nitrosopumilus sp.]|uniref:CFI-box-CTERM domain-containing protein n=1 Tax=Nitrosopumilus sp. TaxID=2024843 RepID=UPI003B5A1DA3
MIILTLGLIFVSPVFGQTSGLDYDIRGGEVTGVDINDEDNSLIILIDTRTKGELVITLPRNLIDAKVNSEDTEFSILINGLGLNFFDEVKTEKDRTITIPFSRSDSEIVITGTHLFGQDKSQQGIENQIQNTINKELKTKIPGNQAKLLIFSDTQWTGAFQSTSFPFTEKNGNKDDSVIFTCDSSFSREAVFGAKFQKLTEDGYLSLVVIQNNEVVSQGSTEESFGEMLISDNCVSAMQSDDGSGQGEGGGCLIATATFGSELAPEVQKLREIRDNSLLQTESGTAFMNSFNGFYYLFSPIIADYERENPIFKEMVKITITPMITSLSILNHVEIDSEMEVLGYGISLILLNAVMYLGFPIGIVVINRKKKIQLINLRTNI